MIEYRSIEGFPGYRVGSDGTVWSSRIKGKHRGITGEWKPCSLYRRPYGARYVVVCMRAVPGGKVSCHYVHRLVLEAFVGRCPDDMECRHFPDRNTGNNTLANLSWGTHIANMADKQIHGTATHGEDHFKSVHSTGDILLIHQMRSQGKTQREIGRVVRMHQAEVSAVLLGKRWARTTSALRSLGLLKEKA